MVCVLRVAELIGVMTFASWILPLTLVLLLGCYEAFPMQVLASLGCFPIGADVLRRSVNIKSSSLVSSFRKKKQQASDRTPEFIRAIASRGEHSARSTNSLSTKGNCGQRRGRQRQSGSHVQKIRQCRRGFSIICVKR